MPRYLDPKSDVVFKKIFGEHPHLLMHFLNAVLPLPTQSRIVQLSYLKDESVPSIPTFKHTVADVKCTDARGRVFIVEMQLHWTDSFKQRLLFGASQAVVKQLERGEAYHLLEPVYGLGLVGEIYDRSTPNWYHHYQLVKKSDAQNDVIDHLQLIFIELPKLPSHLPAIEAIRCLWLRFLQEIDERTEVVPPELLDVPEISEAIRLAEQAAYTPGELMEYEAYWDSVRREKTLIHGKFHEGKAEGKVEGKAEGKAEGKIEGKIEVAINMIKANMPIDKIVDWTGLSYDAVVTLRSQDHLDAMDKPRHVGV